VTETAGFTRTSGFICRTTRPELRPVAQDRTAACHFIET